jgi:CHAD domain-containing protein
VVQLGTDLLAETDSQRLHALRIACKKLRYVLEFFAAFTAQVAHYRVV